MKLIAALALVAFAGSAFGHEIVYQGHEIAHTHITVEFLVLAVVVAALAVLRSK